MFTYQGGSVEVDMAHLAQISHSVQLTRLGGRILFLPLPAIIILNPHRGSKWVAMRGCWSSNNVVTIVNLPDGKTREIAAS